MASVDTSHMQMQQHWGSARNATSWAAAAAGGGGDVAGEGTNTAECGNAMLLAPVDRPWFSLYGARVRPVPGPGSLAHAREDQEPSTLHRMLPDELLMEVFTRMPSWALGPAACVCRKWKYALRSPSLWRTACLRAWQHAEGQKELLQVLRSPPYLGSWRLMWLLRPRLRFEGVYVSRNYYIRCGIVEWAVKNPVHMVCYFRYLRFFPSGKFYYKISPQIVKEVAKHLHSSRQSTSKGGEGFQVGRYTLNSTTGEIHAATMYPGLRPTVLRMRLRLRSTCQGGNNRIDVLSLVTSGLGEAEVPREEEEEDEVLNRCHDWEAEETHDPNIPAVSHNRGTATFVFVPSAQADTHILNLPVDKMDFYVPG